MDCPNSMAPNDEAILHYILDEKPLLYEAMEHLKHCATCQIRVATYQQTERYLIARLYRSQCPSPTQLNLYCAHMLPAVEARQIAEHRDCCPLCRSDIKDIQHILSHRESADTALFPQEN